MYLYTKAGESALITNYRTFSISPGFSKTFEKLMYTNVTDVKNSNQVNFFNISLVLRQLLSTQQAIISLVEKIKGCKTLLIL